MEWLNYHHLLYFWVAAREGSIASASTRLRLAQPTISGQIRVLEGALGEKLFRRAGRGLALTEAGETVFRYADEIFSLGGEMLDALRGRPTGRPLRLVVGLADVIPKLVAYRLLEPALQLETPVRLVCREDKPEQLLARLAVHELDLVLLDAPVPPGAKVRAFNHLLGECGISFYAAPALARRYRKGFPRSLEGAPLLLPTEGANLRRSVEQWLAGQGIRPVVAGEFEDGALLQVFGQAGAGVFPVSDVVERDVRGAMLVGRAPAIRERYYAATLDRRLLHPAVLALTETARSRLFR
jgi:LysR family transcriptional activator of nhaA